MYDQIEMTEYMYGMKPADAEFMMNSEYQIQYNETCMECRKKCKQSFRCEIIQCPKFAQSRKKKAKTK